MNFSTLARNSISGRLSIGASRFALRGAYWYPLFLGKSWHSSRSMELARAKKCLEDFLERNTESIDPEQED
jgi:hypothetical protein